MKLKIGYFYPEYLNLYGDRGNVEILSKRAAARGFDVVVEEVSINTKVDATFMKGLDIVFMGGGPDSSQKEMYADMYHTKKGYITDFIESGGVALVVCASYQLFGNFYKSADGTVLEGLGILDLYTEHFGLKRPRCIGNVVCELNPRITNDPVFASINQIGNTLVGFENHGGRTYLGSGLLPLAKISVGHGNNSEDSTEGVFYKNCVGTYLHGPVLAKNSHLADYLLAKALKVDMLTGLDDSFIIAAHEASLKFKK